MLRYLVFAALAATLSAQGPSGSLIGYTASTSSAGTPPLLQRQELCDPAQRLCPAIGNPVAAHAGGAAYDGARQTLWHTQGTRLVETRIDGCRIVCAVPAANVLGAASAASGLALDEGLRLLYQLESAPGIAALHTWTIRDCPPRELGVCRIRLPSNRHLAGAVALDRRGGFLFYATSTFGPSTPTGNVILVATVSDPCNIICQFQVGPCPSSTRPLGPITGLAHDSCSGSLYVTDGRTMVQLQRTGTLPCDWRVTGCCGVMPSNQEWFGLDVEPEHPHQVGRSCIGHGCPNCTDMELVALGDAVVGNQGFGFRIEDGPAGSLGFLAFNIGECRPQGVPFLCGPIYPSLRPPLAIVPMGPLTGPGCSAVVNMPVPIPLDYGLCGGTMCFQGIVLCRTPGTPGGISLTNGVQIIVDA